MLRALPGFLCLLAASGCATVVPLQTASVVAPGAYRLGGQVTAAPYCTLSAAAVETCATAPATSGAAGWPLPELRANARYGLAASADLGVSAHLLPGPLRAGFFVDGKLELWSRQLADARQLISVGAGAGLTAGLPVAERAGVTQLEAAVPFFFGHQTASLEWVVSPRVIERVAFADLDGNGAREALAVTELGLTVGVFTRGSPSLGLQLGYAAPLQFLSRGPFTVAVSAAFDLPGTPPPAP